MTETNVLLASTARWTAAGRAQENARVDPLFSDPWAEALAGTEGAAWAAERPADRLAAISLRTRFFDDYLQRITHQEGIGQVVLVAAGLDTRAFRLRWPDQTRVFELDQPQVLQSKQETLQPLGATPNCTRKPLGVDLNRPWTGDLVKAGFDPRARSGWLLEGFLFYLPNESLRRQLDEVTALAAPDSWLGFDIINGEVLTSPWTRPWVEMQAQVGAPWIGTLDDPAGYLAERGWRATLTQYGDAEANFGRWPFPVIPSTMPGMPRNWLVTAQKPGV